jgi:uncharacterized membrane-anchored protein YitT (DUF2179 family)
MKKSEKIKRKINDYLFDHRFLRGSLEHLNAFIHALIAALIFAFGFASFITPAVVEGVEGLHIATGGVSGVSQTIALALKMGGVINNVSDDKVSTVISIAYFVINIPILTFAFFKIGKRFAIYSLVNVGLSSLFIFIFTHPEIFHIQIAQLIAKNPMIYNHELVRVLFGAVTVGVSSAFAYRGDVSCGGIDVFSYYFALRKSSSIGKYGILINSVIITSYSTLLVISTRGSDWESGVIAFFFSILYLFVANLIIDAINLRNKKIQVQIITNNEYLTPVLIANFPHGATVVNGEGAYSHQARKVIFMVVSSSQVKDVVTLARKVDHHAFITVTPLSQVYGNFFIKPVE